MSKLQELVNELCPNGVEYKKLKDVCKKITTGKLNANAMVENGEFPFYTCDAKPYRIDKYAFDEEAILISGNGSKVGHVNYYKGKFNAYQRTYVLYDFKEVNIKFLLHYLRGNLRNYIMMHCKKGSIPYITLPMLQDFKIPVPPLPVQEEIAKILDKMTDYVTELKAELKARKMQYEYYRDGLLAFGNNAYKGNLQELINELCPDGVTYEKISTVCNQFNGMTGVSNKWADDGNCRFIDYLNAYNNLKIDTTRLPYATVKNMKQNTLSAGDILCTSASETPDECAISSVIENELPSGIFMDDHLFGIRVKDKTKLNPVFLNYYFRSKEFRLKINKAVRGVTRFYISNPDFMKLSVPVPPLQIQEEIVRILDKFSSICNDISMGLPAEIEARQKQYEYYRNKLLSFQKLEDEEC